MEIAEKTVVSLRYIIRNSDGEEIENTISAPAVKYIHGAGKILPQLENMLAGMKAGDKKSVSIDMPGTFYLDIEIEDVRKATDEELIAGIPATDACGPGCCC
jgi:FKBP-type peptidyl-prolyl cis-trans isomerase SlyD